MEINDPNVLNKMKLIKEKIEKFIAQGRLNDAKEALDIYEKKIPVDTDIWSMRAVIFIMEGKLDDAESVLNDGLKNDSCIFDLLFNLAYIYEQQAKYQEAADMYSKAGTVAGTNENKLNVKNALDNVKSLDNKVILKEKKKLVFFVKRDMDSFLDDIINGLSNEYWTRKIIVEKNNQIDEGMIWADICWFEWCDELVYYGSKLELAKERNIICRIHGYEVYGDIIKKVNWESIDKLIIVAPHIRRMFLENTQGIDKQNLDIITIFCGVNTELYSFHTKKKGYNLGYLGFINYKKNIPLTLKIFKELHNKDPKYKLFLAGAFQDNRTYEYFKYFVKEYKLEDSIIFEGWKGLEEKVEWFKKIDYMIISSIDEGLCFAAAEAMCTGIKPILHNCEGIKDHYDKKYIFDSVDEAVQMVQSVDYDSDSYRSFIEKNYSLEKQIIKINEVLRSLEEKSVKNKFNSGYLLPDIIRNIVEFSPYSKDYIDKFDFISSRIIIGRKEKLNNNFEVIEYILKNNEGKMLILNGILHEYQTNIFIVPEFISESKYYQEILKNLEFIISIDIEYNNGIAGFIFDDEIYQDVKLNWLAYMWERGVPATQFMPLKGFQNVIERYRLVGKYTHQNDIVLEAASGFGYGAAYCATKLGCQKVVALDLAEDTIKFGKNAYDFGNIEWVNGDVTNLPFDNNSFDVYISFETLEHLPLDLVDAYFVEATRVLNKGGKFIVSTPNKTMRTHIHNPFHIKEYTFNELDTLFKKYFVHVEYHSICNNYLYQGVNLSASNFILVGSNEEEKS